MTATRFNKIPFWDFDTNQDGTCSEVGALSRLAVLGLKAYDNLKLLDKNLDNYKDGTCGETGALSRLVLRGILPSSLPCHCHHHLFHGTFHLFMYVPSDHIFGIICSFSMGVSSDF